MTPRIIQFVCVCLLTAPVQFAGAETKENKKIGDATEVLHRIMHIPEEAVPSSLLSKAYGVAVIPDVIKVGVGIGGRRGKGILVVRGENNAWSQPSFVTLTGGGIGFQIGAQATDIILVFKSRKGVDNISRGKLTLGGDASVAAGPVGRHTSAATDIKFQSEVYSYSRSRGIFAGVSLEGAVLQMDNKANARFYNLPSITPAQIFAGDAPPAASQSQTFIELLARHAAPPSLAAPEAGPVETTGDGVRTFAIDEPSDFRIAEDGG